MTNESAIKRRGFPWRIIGWGAVVVLLTLPKVLGFPWTAFDYIVAGGLLGGAGLVLELLVRASPNLAYRGGAAVAVLAALLLVWVNGAVGFLGNEDNPANLMFAGVIGIAALGAAMTGFRARGMAWAMFAAAAAQVLVAVIAVIGGLGSPGMEGIREAVLGTSLFGAMWLAAGGLFRRAAADEAAVER